MMRRRFTRRGRPRAGDGASPLDAGRLLARVAEAGLAGAGELEPLDVESRGDVPESYAALGRGETEQGRRVIVSVAPERAGDALLAGLATVGRLAADGGFEGELVVAASEWPLAARRRLALVRSLDFRLRTAALPALADGGAPAVRPESPSETVGLAPERLAAQLERAEDRAVFLRAAAALEGLAAKHGGAVRSFGRRVELVLLARCVAQLRAEEGEVRLQTLLPTRSTARLVADELAGELDRLEGNLRKRLNDRRVREGDEGVRARVLPLLGTAAGLRGVRWWPVGGADPDVIDLVGADASGLPVVAAVRSRLALADLGVVLDALSAVGPSLPHLLADAPPPVRLAPPRLLLAAQEFDESAARVLPFLSVAHALYDVRSGRGRGFELAEVASGEAPRTTRPAAVEPARAAAPAPEREREPEPQPEAEEAEPSRRGEGRRRRGGRRRGRGGRGPRREEAEPFEADAGEEREALDSGEAEEAEEEPRPRRRFDELSLFDLEEDVRPAGGAEEGGRRRGRRGRSRRRGRRGGASEDSESEPARSRGGRGGFEADEDEDEAEGERERGGDAAELDEDLELSGGLAPIEEEEPSFEELAHRYEDEEGGGEEDELDPEEESRLLERERRRLARLAKLDVEKEEPKPARPPRRRSALLVHADRDSVLAAVVLARDIRLLEGVWIYPQAELMTFFRSVATDLREEAPIYVVGFKASPAHEVLQAAALYRGRIQWFDHHDWPPEDLDGLRQAIGDESVHVVPGASSSLPPVLEVCSRRSRFSDKLVDLGTGRFSVHDFERWGRLWWSRLGEIAERTGERRHDVDPLLIGRPSDLARESSRAPTPPLPPEVDFVSRRDFRLVHFSGYTLIVVDVPEGLDLHLAARIARERYAAPLSLAYQQGGDMMVLSGEETTGRHALDYTALVEHLAGKFEWIQALADTDHVARFRVEDLPGSPERLDDVVGEIAMGRSILER